MGNSGAPMRAADVHDVGGSPDGSEEPPAAPIGVRVSTSFMVPRTANEVVVEDDVELEVRRVDEHTKIEPLGTTQSCVRNLIVVRAVGGGRPLDLDVVVCTESRTVVGIIEEVMGPTSQPFYSIRKVKGLDQVPDKDSTLYYVADGATFAQPSTSKGCDASNMFDEEVAEHELEFSDDEQEQQHKRARKKRSNRKPQQQKQQQQPPPGVGGGGLLPTPPGYPRRQ